MRTPAHIYEKWLEPAKELVGLRKKLWKLEDELKALGLTPEEIKAHEEVVALKEEIKEKFEAFRDSIWEFKPEKPFSVGPYTVKYVTEHELVLAKRPDTPWAETLLFDEIRLYRFTDNPTAWAMFIAGKADIEKPATPPLVVAEILARQPKIKHVPVSDFTTFCIMINHTRPPLDKLEFRQALAHIIDRDLVMKISQPYGERVKYISGMLPTQLERWTTPELRALLNPYPLDQYC